MVLKEMTSPRANYIDWIGSGWTSIFHWTMWIAATLTIHRRLATRLIPLRCVLQTDFVLRAVIPLRSCSRSWIVLGIWDDEFFCISSSVRGATGQTTIDQDLNPFLCCYGGANWLRSRRGPTFEVLNFFGDLKWRVLFAFVVPVRGATGEKTILRLGSIPLRMVVQSATNWLRSRRRPSFKVLFQILKIFYDLRWRVLFAFVVPVRGATGKTTNRSGPGSRIKKRYLHTASCQERKSQCVRELPKNCGCCVEIVRKQKRTHSGDGDHEHYYYCVSLSWYFAPGLASLEICPAQIHSAPSGRQQES